MPPYNPDIHHRRSIRLKEYDYSKAGYYFVTICTRNRELFFERYPVLRAIVHEEWYAMSERFPYVELDAFVIMPNHIHGILIIQSGKTYAETSRLLTLGDIIRAFKSITFPRWLQYIQQNNIVDAIGKFWQRNYYEHIIRNEDNLNQIREYILNNPLQWELDVENPCQVEK